MTEVIIKDKQNYLNENYPFVDIPALTDRKHCIHYGMVITVGDFKVYKDKTGFEFICCPNAPACDGTVRNNENTKQMSSKSFDIIFLNKLFNLISKK